MLSWLFTAEDTLNLYRLGSVQNPNWKTLKNLAIWLDSTCALSVRHHSEQSRKADYSAGNAGDTSRAVFRKWLINLRQLEPVFLTNLSLDDDFNLLFI
ncbi:hypothetical protein AUF62_01665 [archaeon 13_1_20CM_52_20]|nr:MAG: hypothetical protein AUF62_01665 [archaeon 13_1_20CM_52_20]